MSDQQSKSKSLSAAAKEWTPGAFSGGVAAAPAAADGGGGDKGAGAGAGRSMQAMQQGQTPYMQQQHGMRHHGAFAHYPVMHHEQYQAFTVQQQQQQQFMQQMMHPNAQFTHQQVYGSPYPQPPFPNRGKGKGSKKFNNDPSRGGQHHHHQYPQMQFQAAYPQAPQMPMGRMPHHHQHQQMQHMQQQEQPLLEQRVDNLQKEVSRMNAALLALTGDTPQKITENLR